MDECLDALADVAYPKFEVLVVTDVPADAQRASVRYLESGPVGPAAKRDQGAKAAHGDILAFIDDDAFPDRDWLHTAMNVFGDPSVTAVGGPGLTPPGDSALARASGWILSSYLGGGPHRFRSIKAKARWVDDYPSMNFLVRRSAFEEVGGFSTHFFPGEDTKLCLALISDGGRIRYDPNVVVYHHRRDLFRPYLRQIAQYGLHRGHSCPDLPPNLAPVELHASKPVVVVGHRRSDRCPGGAANLDVIQARTVGLRGRPVVLRSRNRDAVPEHRYGGLGRDGHCALPSRLRRGLHTGVLRAHVEKVITLGARK